MEADALGVALERGFIKVDRENRCGENLWAIGDVAGRGLAHVASAEGVFVAERIAGRARRARPLRLGPRLHLLLAGDRIARPHRGGGQGRRHPDKVGRFPFRALAKALGADEPKGFVKVLYHAETGALVGAHLLGPAVADLIAELTLTKTTEVNAESLLHTIHAHPTFAEAVRIATEDALGRAIDL